MSFLLFARSPEELEAVPHNDSSADHRGGISVTASDLNPIIQMTTWLFLALTSLMLCFRLITKFYLRLNSKLFSPEELLSFSAYAFSLGQSLTVLLPQGRILGKDIGYISVGELKDGLRSAYVGDLLFVLSLGFAKLSICACLLVLSPDVTHRHLIFGLCAVITLWTLSSSLGLCFRCGAHLPWNARSEECFNLHSFLLYEVITNILTDAALVALPVVMVYPSGLPWKTRISVLLIFGSRTLVIISAIFQLTYLSRLFDSSNYTLRAFPYYLCTQIVQFASIATTCTLYFRPLLESLRSGLMWTDNVMGTAATNTVFTGSGASSSFQQHHTMEKLDKSRDRDAT